MRSKFQIGIPLFLAAMLTSPLLFTGCAVHARVYDPYYHDYHAWDGESGYYVQWENDTHRRHEDFDRRSDEDRKAYWDWRHQHDHDHDNH